MLIIKKIFVLLVFGYLSMLTGCATIIKGSTDNVTVNAPQCPRAECTLKNAKGVWHADKLPSTVTVQKDGSDLNVSCSADQGTPAEKTLPSKTEGWVWGNIILGGLIGLAVDYGTGGIHNYDDSVDVPLACSNAPGAPQQTSTGGGSNTAPNVSSQPKSEETAQGHAADVKG